MGAAPAVAPAQAAEPRQQPPAHERVRAAQTALEHAKAAALAPEVIATLTAQVEMLKDEGRPIVPLGAQLVVTAVSRPQHPKN